ncbi:lysophospholipid acyltransferase family protein [Pseudonocardia sp. H11422]|uniref:lysophospholipid acyltransferase family protein n=1 Tax=Pseudonocardia sp. H11422 TaxID=2835866 RepID=UPI001BDDAC2D|nr:lysophospholipid acyltransferase family protein [Pseudonocardia sp. H11422]
MARLRVLRRLVALSCWVLAAVPIVAVSPLCGGRVHRRATSTLFRGVLGAAAVQLRVTGAASYGDGPSGVLVVANHLSWIDVLALGAVQPVRMLAKREVRDWPVIGWLARRNGALFVDRSGLRGLPAVIADTAAALRDGAAVGVFPEGTTWCGSASGPFRRAAFQAAIDAGVPVRPVSIALRLPDGRPTTEGAFVGDQTLFDSMLRVLCLPALVCEVTVHREIVALPGEDRRALALRAERVVVAVTGVRPGSAEAASPRTRPVAA